MQSVLARADRAQLRMDPFPHLVVRDALDPALYAALAASFPSLDIVNAGRRPVRNNSDHFLGSADILRSDAIAAEWRKLVAYHVSAAFWQEVLALAGDAFRSIQPAAERLLGKPLEALRVAAVGDPVPAEVRLECQFGVNAPVSRRSSVRTAHLDRPNKIFNALLYCRHPADDTPGGELILYRFKDRPAFGRRRTAAPDRLLEAARIPYEANTLVLFLSGPQSVHGVGPCPPTPHVRRYVNFHAELARDLFALPRANPLAGWLARLRRGGRAAGAPDRGYA